VIYFTLLHIYLFLAKMVAIISDSFPHGVQHLPGTASAGDFITPFKLAGGVIIENDVTEEAVNQCNEEIHVELERIAAPVRQHQHSNNSVP
jgi:hypothetical protein